MNVVEDREQVKLTVTAARGLQAGFQGSAITIVDNDIPNITVLNRGTVVEGHADRQIFFTIKLVNQRAERPVTVCFQTEDGSARAGEDYYSVVNGSAEFQISTYFPIARAYVTIRGDWAKAFSLLENFYLKLLPRADYTLVNDTSTCVIRDDDGLIK